MIHKNCFLEYEIKKKKLQNLFHSYFTCLANKQRENTFYPFIYSANISLLEQKTFSPKQRRLFELFSQKKRSAAHNFGIVLWDLCMAHVTNVYCFK